MYVHKFITIIAKVQVPVKTQIGAVCQCVPGIDHCLQQFFVSAFQQLH